jgi:hypothetical protein
MTDYKQSNTTIDVVKWQRCYKVDIFNNYQSVPMIEFNEQEITSIGSEIVVKNINTANPLRVEYAANSIINIVNPETLEPVEGQTFTHLDLYVMLFSAYIDAALQRDAAQSNTP